MELLQFSSLVFYVDAISEKGSAAGVLVPPPFRSG